LTLSVDVYHQRKRANTPEFRKIQSLAERPSAWAVKLIFLNQLFIDDKAYDKSKGMAGLTTTEHIESYIAEQWLRQTLLEMKSRTLFSLNSYTARRIY